jgi:hypothetical protein
VIKLIVREVRPIQPGRIYYVLCEGAAGLSKNS